MILIVGEGKYDAIFFLNIIKSFNADLKCEMEYDSFEKIIRKIKNNPISDKNAVFIYGNSGSGKILNESLYLIREFFSLNPIHHKICVIRDDDGGNRKEIFKKYSRQITDFFSKKNFSSIPDYKIEENLLTITRKNMHILTQFDFVSQSLEYHLSKLIIKKNEYSHLKTENYHDIIKRYLENQGIEIEKFIEESFLALQNEAWVEEIKKRFLSLLS